MKWNRNQGNWNQMTGQEKEKLGSTSDDGATIVKVWRDQLDSLLQRRFGYAREQTGPLTSFDTGLHSLVQHNADVQVGKLSIIAHGTAYEAERAREFLFRRRVNPE
jgi:uncharacterized protein YjbJ (UPF0337 family)